MRRRFSVQKLINDVIITDVTAEKGERQEANNQHDRLF